MQHHVTMFWAARDEKWSGSNRSIGGLDIVSRSQTAFIRLLAH